MLTERVRAVVRHTTADTISVRKAALLLCVFLIAVQLAFTAIIRGYVVPHLTPAAHWQFGLRVDSDSQLFHDEAANLAALTRSGRSQDPREASRYAGMIHTRIFASLYVLVGSDTPYAAYVLNAVLLAGTGLLVFAILRHVGIRASLAAMGAAVVTAGPMNLFAYSELLREPFIVPAMLLFVLGLLTLFEPPVQGRACIRAPDDYQDDRARRDRRGQHRHVAADARGH